MGWFSRIAKSATRFLGGGEKALRKIGDTARAIKSFGRGVNKFTGGLAGKAWEASKNIPVYGKVTRGIESGLDMADKYSTKGLEAIAIGKKARNIKSFGDALDVAKRAKNFITG